MKNKEEFEFQTEMTQLLHLLANSLYTNREIFLRELISNASDALSKMNFQALTDIKILGDDKDLKINIIADEKEKTFTVIDNGIGMTKDDLINHLGTIAQSGTQNFMKDLKEEPKKTDSDFIGKFGVGFYSVFMVTEEVTVETRHFSEEKGYRWTSQGSGKFTIEEIEKKERGTKIFFIPKKDATKFCDTQSVENAIKKYSDFVFFPIELNGEKKNKSEAIWRKSKRNVKPEEYGEFYKYISHKNTEPLGTFHFNVESATNSFDAILFVPGEQDRNLFQGKSEAQIQLYVKRVFIQDDCKELLPNWLRFMHGLVDSQDLPLNVSREVTQASPVLQKINTHLVKKVLDEFAKWAKSDKEKFELLWKNFGIFLKEGIHMDFVHKDRLTKLYHAYSSKSQETLISLEEYTSRMQEGQTEIFYAFGKNREAIENSPNYEYFLNKEIEVLYIYDEIDDFILPVIGQFNEKTFVSISKAEIKSDSKEKPPEENASSDENKKLLQFFKDILGDRIEDAVASERLVESPCTLVSSKDGMTGHMEKMLKMMNQDFQGSKRILEVNLGNSLVKNLKKIRKKFPQDALVKDCIMQLYENAAMIDGILEDTTKMPARLNAIMQKASEYHLKNLEK